MNSLRGITTTGPSPVRTRRLAAAAGAAVLALTLSACATDTTPAASPSPSPSASATPVLDAPIPSLSPLVTRDAGKSWDSVPDADLPPLLPADADLAVEAREMADWVWDYVDETWELTVAATAAQAETGGGVVLLVAPDGDSFKLYALESDQVGEVVHWDPAKRIAWLSFWYTESTGVFQVDLTTGQNMGDWAPEGVDDGAGDGSVVNAFYVGEEPTGREVWLTYGVWSYGVTTLFFRNPDGSFEVSAGWGEWMGDTDLFISQSAVQAWFDLDRGVIIYRYADVGTVEQEKPMEVTWFEHDLDTDALTPLAPQDPGGTECSAPAAWGDAAQFSDGAPVLVCHDADYNNTTYRIDINGANPPEVLG